MTQELLHPGLGSGALREALTQCKESLDAIWAAIGDALLSDRGLNSAYANSVAAEARTASDAARAALSLSSPIESEIRLGVHLQHCNFGEYPNACKYGEDDCPALTESWSWFGKALERARPTSQASSEMRERKNGESNLPWLQRVKLDGYIACGQHGDRYGENSQVWDLTCERCSQRFDAIVHVLEALAPRSSKKS